jgi:RNA polymerase sigma-70 factor (ECF subfamily)
MTVVAVGGDMSDTADSWPKLADSGSHDRSSPGRAEGAGRRRGDMDALAAELFAAHYGRLAGWLRKLVDDDDTAHELAMEAFTRLLGKLKKVDDPVGYLFVVAANLVRDHWRKTRRERDAMRWTKEATARDYSVNGAGNGAVPGADLRSLVESLPERQRVSVLLFYYAGFPLNDVARFTNRPVGTVKSDLFQARAQLRRALDGTP